MSFSPDLFLSNINGKDGLARNNRFEVILPIPTYINSFINQSALEYLLNLPNSLTADITDAITNALGSTNEQSKTANSSMSRYLALQCENAELPGRTLQTADVKIYGPTFKVPYQSQYSEINLTFLCTNEFYERKLFDKWIDAIMPHDTNNLRFPKGSSTRYLTNIKVIQYDDFIRQIYAVELEDAFPIGISSQPLSWSDEGFHRVTVQFAYQKYKVVYAGNYDLVAAATQLFGSKFTSFSEGFSNKISSGVGKIFDSFF